MIQHVRVGIKPNELRIGIYVYSVIPHKDSFVNNNISKLDEEYLELLLKTKQYDAIAPIPITPEILEKTGFEKGEWHSAWDIKTEEGIFEIHQINGEHDGYEYFGSEWTHGKTFYFVHQLQNLCFALTGKEFQIIL